jgi:hypothetical protein
MGPSLRCLICLGLLLLPFLCGNRIVTSLMNRFHVLIHCYHGGATAGVGIAVTCTGGAVIAGSEKNDS